MERFIGRAYEVECALVLLTTPRDATNRYIAAVAATNGMGSVNKTALATEVVMARQLFPGGIVVVICKLKREPIEVLKLALSRFTDGRRELDDTTLPQLTDRARSQLAGKHALVVLDNVEKDWPIQDVVQPLLAAGAAVLVTSQASLPAISKEATVKLDVLSSAEVLDLFAEYYGRGAALDLTCAELVAANAATLERPLDTIASELEKHPAKALLLEDSEEAVRYVLASSIEALQPLACRFFALLGTFATADIGRLAALGVVCALFDESEAAAEAALKEMVALLLADPGLIETMPSDWSDRDRICLHLLV